MSVATSWSTAVADRWRSLCAGLLLFIGICLPIGIAHAESVEILVSPEHATVPVDRGFLRAIFTMRTREWPDGAAIHVFVLPDSSEIHDAFCREYLGIYPYVLRNAWDRMVFTGTGFAPDVVHSESEMRQKIRATPGSIGYVRKASVSSPSVQPKEVSHEK